MGDSVRTNSLTTAAAFKRQWMRYTFKRRIGEEILYGLNPLCIPDVLKTVFSFLPLHYLPRCRLVSRQWDEEANSLLQNRSHVVFKDLEGILKFQEIFSPQRNFCTKFWFLDCPGDNSEVLHFFQEYGGKAKMLRLLHPDDGILHSVFNNCFNLDTLELSLNISVIHFTLWFQYGQVNLPNLKTLKIHFEEIANELAEVITLAIISQAPNLIDIETDGYSKFVFSHCSLFLKLRALKFNNEISMEDFYHLVSLNLGLNTLSLVIPCDKHVTKDMFSTCFQRLENSLMSLTLSGSTSILPHGFTKMHQRCVNSLSSLRNLRYLTLTSFGNLDCSVLQKLVNLKEIEFNGTTTMLCLNNTDNQDMLPLPCMHGFYHRNILPPQAGWDAIYIFPNLTKFQGVLTSSLLCILLKGFPKLEVIDIYISSNVNGPERNITNVIVPGSGPAAPSEFQLRSVRLTGVKVNDKACMWNVFKTLSSRKHLVRFTFEADNMVLRYNDIRSILRDKRLHYLNINQNGFYLPSLSSLEYIMRKLEGRELIIGNHTIPTDVGSTRNIRSTYNTVFGLQATVNVLSSNQPLQCRIL